jgi:ornithine cyclodeaminase
MHAMALRLLTADDVRAALPMPEAIEAMREAYLAVSGDRAVMPLRTHLVLPGGLGATLTMPAATSGPVRLGTKLLTLFPGNPSRGLPFIQGLVVMFDAETGRPTGLLEGTALTAIRTRAASGLAPSVLANAGASRVGIIGSGTQARTQLEAVCCAREVEQVAVFSLDDAQPFIEEMQGKERVPQSIHIASSAAEIAENADIICTATTASIPVLQKEDICPGTHINAVGSYTPAMQELDPHLLADANLVVDQVSATMDEAGEVIAAVSQGLIRESELVELGRVISGAYPGRQSESEITIFKSVGVAAQDLCAAARALQRAEDQSIGMVLEL